MKKIRSFLADVRKEMTKVHFPTKKDMVMYSIATIAFILILSAFFMSSDIIIGFFKKLVHWCKKNGM